MNEQGYLDTAFYLELFKFNLDEKGFKELSDYADRWVETVSQPPEMVRFSDKLKTDLNTMGYVIYPLIGRSINDQIRNGLTCNFYVNYTERRTMRQPISNWLTAIPTTISEVAFQPSQAILLGTQGMTYEQQVKRVSRYSNGLRKMLNSEEFSVVIGTAPDLSQVVYKHYRETGEVLLPRMADRSRIDHTRTSTHRVGGGICLGNVEGLPLRQDLAILPLSYKSPSLAVVPLLFPTAVLV